MQVRIPFGSKVTISTRIQIKMALKIISLSCRYYLNYYKMHHILVLILRKIFFKCPRILVTVTNFVMVFINGGGMSYISIRLLTFITYVHCVFVESIFGDGHNCWVIYRNCILWKYHDL